MRIRDTTAMYQLNVMVRRDLGLYFPWQPLTGGSAWQGELLAKLSQNF